MAGPRFKPRIDDRHDKLAFILAFVVGAAGILIIRILSTDTPLSLFDFLAVAIAVSVIVGYTAYILVSTNRTSISLDRAGDNAYYLGLLFTLISLCYSLWKVAELAMAADGETAGIRSADRVISLLPDFGLALSSTIAGIFARVIVQQFRNDPADIETQARQELGWAIQQLRHSLLQAVSDMNNTSRSANVAITEIQTRMKKTLEQSMDAHVELMSRLGQTMTKATDHFAGRVRPVSESLKKLSDELVAAVSHIKEQVDKLNFDGTPVEQNIESLSVEFGNMRQQMVETRDGCQAFSSELSDISTKLSNLISKDFAEQLQSTESGVLEQQGQLLSQLEKLNNDATQLGRKLGGAGDSVSGVTENIERVDAANQSLASELESAGNRVADSIQKVLSEFNSLHKRLQRTELKSPTQKKWFWGLFRRTRKNVP